MAVHQRQSSRWMHDSSLTSTWRLDQHFDLFVKKDTFWSALEALSTTFIEIDGNPCSNIPTISLRRHHQRTGLLSSDKQLRTSYLTTVVPSWEEVWLAWWNILNTEMLMLLTTTLWQPCLLLARPVMKTMLARMEGWKLKRGSWQICEYNPAQLDRKMSNSQPGATLSSQLATSARL